MIYHPFDLRQLAKETHSQCDFFLHQHHQHLSFDCSTQIKNDETDNEGGKLSDIFTPNFVSPICYTVKIKDCIIGPRPEGISRYWPVFFGENYAFNFLSTAAKEAYVRQQIFKTLKDDSIEFDATTIDFVEINGPCVWLYTFYNVDHLIRETLPTIVALEEMGLDLRELKFIVPSVSGTGILELLTALGIPLQNIIQAERQWLRFKEVYVPCFFSFGHLHTPSSYYRATANRVLRAVRDIKTDTKTPKRIFVSRERANMRRLLNEKYIHSDLIDRGFEIIDPGSLTKLAQAKYLNNAEIVVGQHGMGIANGIYAQPGCKIVEIMHTNYNRVSYFRTAQYLSGEYGAYYVRPIELKYSHKSDKFGDVLVDKTDLIEFIDRFI